MFTGIIEALGSITAIQEEGTNRHFTVYSPISNELKIDQSIAHNGVCLTVVALSDASHTVTAIDETLQKTNLNEWKVGKKVNLERCMQMNGRLDGHIVQGHVDGVAQCVRIENKNGSWVFTFTLPEDKRHLVVDKGSITVNGTSLTVVDPTLNEFSVAIIPYTYEHTVFHQLRVGDAVNLEFDIIGKYLERMMLVKQS